MHLLRSFSRHVLHSNLYDKYLLAKGTCLGIPEKLSDIIQVEKLQHLSPSNIATIWRAHYESKPASFSTSISSSTFSKWMEKSSLFPIFVVPLETGPNSFVNYIVTHQIASSNLCAGFCSLAEYQTLGSSSCLQLFARAFADFRSAKDLILILSRFDGETISRARVEKLVKATIYLYSANTDWIRTFHQQPHCFDYGSFLDYFKTINLDQ